MRGRRYWRWIPWSELWWRTVFLELMSRSPFDNINVQLHFHDILVGGQFDNGALELADVGGYVIGDEGISVLAEKNVHSRRLFFLRMATRVSKSGF